MLVLILKCFLHVGRSNQMLVCNFTSKILLESASRAQPLMYKPKTGSSCGNFCFLHCHNLLRPEKSVSATYLHGEEGNTDTQLSRKLGSVKKTWHLASAPGYEGDLSGVWCPPPARVGTPPHALVTNASFWTWVCSCHGGWDNPLGPGACEGRGQST